MIFAGCHSRPDYVLDDRQMEDLLVDIYKSEAIIDMNRTNYNNDSIKAVIKQSVFLKHGVTQEEYDSTLVWYGHNITQYIKVYENVIARLEDEEYNLKNASSGDSRRTVKKVSRKNYPSTGDSADIWDDEQIMIFMPQFDNNILRFDYQSRMDDKDGDRYDFVFRVRNSREPVKVYLGVDYPDGTTSYMYRGSANEGENHLIVQSDSTKHIRRVYGYITTNPSVNEAVFVDSIMLLRTRLDSTNYSTFNGQKWIGPKRLNPKFVRQQAIDREKEKAELQKKMEEERKAAEEPKQRQRRYTPRPSENRSNHQAAND